MSCTAVGLAFGFQQKHLCSSAVKDAEIPSGNGGGWSSLAIMKCRSSTGVVTRVPCQGGCPVAISKTVPPRAQISIGRPSESFLCNTSGAMNAGEPGMPRRRSKVRV
eukprot:19606-Heterococcus_DN1.PRE.1